MSGPGLIMAMIVVTANATSRCWSIGMARSLHMSASGYETWLD